MFIVYGKYPNSKRFKPVGSSGLVTKLIYAIMFADKDIALKDCEILKANNPGWCFEVRKK